MKYLVSLRKDYTVVIETDNEDNLNDLSDLLDINTDVLEEADSNSDWEIGDVVGLSKEDECKFTEDVVKL